MSQDTDGQKGGSKFLILQKEWLFKWNEIISIL